MEGEGRFLLEILKRKRREVEADKGKRPLTEVDLLSASSGPSLYQALREGNPPRIIAEVKRGSPSKGRIRTELDPLVQARLYQKGGARAISILTDSAFWGSIEDLKDVASELSLPLLRKDFIIDSYQLYQSLEAGASGVLLVVAALELERLRELVERSFLLSLEPLVEVHTLEELEEALSTSARIIGINNRNLHTFQVDLSVTELLAPQVPKDRLVVSESGVKGKEDIDRLMKAGVKNFLVGEALVRAKDPAEKLHELMGR